MKNTLVYSLAVTTLVAGMSLNAAPSRADEMMDYVHKTMNCMSQMLSSVTQNHSMQAVRSEYESCIKG